MVNGSFNTVKVLIKLTINETDFHALGGTPGSIMKPWPCDAKFERNYFAVNAAWPVPNLINITQGVASPTKVNIVREGIR